MKTAVTAAGKKTDQTPTPQQRRGAAGRGGRGRGGGARGSAKKTPSRKRRRPPADDGGCHLCFDLPSPLVHVGLVM